ncbi:MAG: hypothetical protein ACREP9_10340 [Candidatus Dormibacteraceae bacterium]
MSPMLRMFWKCETQFRPLNELIKVAGANGVQLLEMDTTFDYEFEFMTGKNVPPMI